MTWIIFFPARRYCMTTKVRNMMVRAASGAPTCVHQTSRPSVRDARWTTKVNGGLSSTGWQRTTKAHTSTWRSQQGLKGAGITASPALSFWVSQLWCTRAVVFRTNYYLYQSCQLLLFLYQYAHWITCFRCVSVEMCAKVQLPPISGFWPLPVLPAVLSRHLSVAIKL